MALQRGTLIRNLYYDMKSTGTLTSSQMKTTKTAQGKLTVFEQTKAVAFQKAIAAMEKHLGKSCWELTGQGKADFTAGHLRVQGGGQPSGRAIKAIWAKVQQDGERFPGQTPVKQVGRPPQITQDQKQAIAHKAMGLKQELVAPTPERVRICMPRKTINKTTKKPISNSSIQRDSRPCVMMSMRTTFGNIATRLNRIASPSKIFQPGSRLPSMSFAT